MPSFFKITDEDIEQASQVDMAELLESLGETVKGEGKYSYWLDGDQKVTLIGNRWFHQYERVGGNPINFVRRYLNKTFPEAVCFLLNGRVAEITYTNKPAEHKKVDFSLPQKDGSNYDMYRYLCKNRKLDRDVVEDFEHAGLIYQSSNGKFKNVVFVGIDKDEVPRHAHMRGTAGSFKGNASGSQDEYSFHWNGTSNEIFLFEAPIDMMSYICLYGDKQWQEHTYAAACGVSDKVLMQCLKDHPNLNKVHLCLDNDEAGLSAIKRIAETLNSMGIQNDSIIPFDKDWNEDLIAIEESEGQQWNR